MNPIFDPLYYIEGRNEKHFIGAALGAVGSIVGGIASSKIAGKESRKNAQQAQQHSDYQLQNKHQWD